MILFLFGCKDMNTFVLYDYHPPFIASRSYGSSIKGGKKNLAFYFL